MAEDEAYQDIRAKLHEAMIAELGEHPDAIEKRARREAEGGYERG